ncbi:Glycosylated lysosomal membrane protein B [Nymphon striatum]|nr:Glycosylated lysosomal membrane protein B [Nymphon striatum]
MEIYLIVLVLLSSYVAIIQSSPSRKFSVVVNPDCGKTCEHINLTDTEFNNIVHVIGTGEKDALHYVWSSVGAPAVLIAHTEKNVSLKVNWDQLLSDNSSNALHFTGKVHYSFAAIMTKLYEYNDKHNNAKFVPDNDTITYNLDELTWNNINDSIETSSEKVSAIFKTSNESRGMLHDGHILIKMSANGKKDRQKDLPHQLWTVNSSLIDFTIDGLKASFKKSRIAAEMVFISFDNTNIKTVKHIDYEMINTIDDEYTPSVFETYNLKSAETRISKTGGYMQWKPISYLTSKHKYVDSTPIKVGNFNVSRNVDEIPFSVPKAFYGDNISEAEFANLTITFGVENGKDFYTGFNYSTWTVAVGYGTPPQNEMSLTVILVLSIGVGLPLVLLFVGGIYSLIKKFKGDNRRDMLILNVDD